MQTILIIEDNEEIRDNTAELLAINHFNVLTADNGRTGFDVAKSKNPDLILCDMVMPETDGQGFLELLNKNESVRKIPIIFFSAGTSLPSVQNKLIKAADGF